MKPLPNSLEYSVEGSTRLSSNAPSNYSKDLLVSWKSQSDPLDELWAEFPICEYPPHVRNLLTQTVTHEEIRIYSGARVETAGSETCEEQIRGSRSQSDKPLHLLIKSTKRNNIDRAVAWIRRLIDQAMNLPKYKEKVLIGLESSSPSFDVRGKVLGPAGANLQYITNETGAIVTLRGRGSGFIEPTTGLESIEPLHLCVEHNSKYEVLQAGRQLAFNLIETVQQEWYTYQQQQQTTNSTLQTQSHTAQGTLQAQSHATQGTLQAAQSHAAANPTAMQQQHVTITNPVLQTHQQQQHATVTPVLQHAAPQHLHIPPPPAPHQAAPPHQGGVASGQLVPPPTTAVPPPLLSSTTVPPPLVHQPPPTTLQLATSLSQLVQAPPPHLQAGQLSQPPPQLVQSAAAQQAGQPTAVPQPQQQQLVQQPQGLSLLQQGQPSILQAQQALSQGMLVPGTGVGPGQTVQVLQTSQLSAAIQPSAQTTLQELPPTHVYSTGAGSGAGTQVANILTQQVLPAGTSIIQQPHIISQTSYPQLQYMQGGGGSMAVLYGAPGGATSGREGVMLVQYAGGAAAGARRLQPHIVQLVHPGTGQVMPTGPLLLQGPSTPLVLQQPSPAPPTTSLLLQQPSPAPPPPVSTATALLLQQPTAPQHQLQFSSVQPQPIHIIPPPHQTMMTVSSSGQVVTSAAQSMVTSSQHGLVSISPHTISSPPMSRAIISAQGQKRRFDHDHITIQGNAVTGTVSIGEVSSLHKKGVGEGSPSKVVREQLSQSATPSLHSKLVVPASQSDEQDMVQVSRVEMKPDSVKRGRTSHGDELEVGKETKTVYSYAGGGKLNYSQPPPQHSAAAAAVLQQQQQDMQQTQQHMQQVQQQQAAQQQQQQGLVSAQLAQTLATPAQFTAPPPHYPTQYYQQPPYQTYQPSWSHMHPNSNQ